MINCKKGLTVGLLAVLIASCFVGLASADSAWLEGYSKRMLFYWQSSGAGQSSFTVINQTNFNTANTFYIFNETQSDFEDLRVTLSDGETLLPIWNQTTIEQTSVKVWCNFPTANVSYYLYWNNPDALASWNQIAVFNAVISNTLGAYNLNENTSTTANDLSGNNYNGTLTGSPLPNWVNGKFNSALQFDGAHNYVLVNDAAPLRLLNTDFSIFAWIYPDSTSPAYQGIVNKAAGGVGWGFWFLSNQKLEFWYGAGKDKLSDSTIPLNQWSFVGIVFNNTAQTVSFYVNDNLDVTRSTADQTPTVSNSADPINIGRLFSNSAYTFNGVIDEVFIFNCAISTTEAVNMYNNYFDTSIETGKVYVRSWLTESNIGLFGVVESAPVVEPTVNPADVSADDAAALAVVFGFIAIALAVAFGVSKRK